jgi:RNA polymerase sigma factor (sigma-70 family)
MEPTDRTLCVACKEGDEQAWEALLNRYERLVYSIPLNYGLSAADAADIAQLTFAYLLESIDNLRDDSNLGGWLATVARRQSWRVISARKREIASKDLEEVGGAVLWSSQADWLRRWEDLEWIQSGLIHLQERCQQLLLLLYLDPQELSYDEIAARLGMKVGSIGPTRARCLERLREFLER